MASDLDAVPPTGFEALAMLQHGVADVLAQSATAQAAIAKALETIAGTLHWGASAYWHFDAATAELRRIASWTDGTPALVDFDASTRNLSLGRGVGLPGRVAKLDSPAWIEDIGADPNFPRAARAIAAGIRSALAFPVSVAGELVGVMEFLSLERRPRDDQLLRAARTSGRQIGLYLARARAQEAIAGSEATKRAILDASLDAIVSIDEHGKILDFNAAAERMFGRRTADVVGQDFAEIAIPERLRAAHRAGIRRHLETGTTTVMGRVIELPALRPDGSEFPATSSAKPTSSF